MVNGIFPLISLSDLSSFIYRNKIYFCVQVCILKLPNSLISSKSFLVASLGFPMCRIMSSANSDSFTSYPICIPFKTSKTMLNKNDKGGHPCLIPDLSGNSFSFSPLRMMLAVGLSYMTFIMLMYVPLIPIFRGEGYYKWMLDFVKSFFCIY
uniref:Uncharacterized protein n=1 Tax=Sus scrofa TaxID=9823 RepID=A0A8D0TVQ3_PIG